MIPCVGIMDVGINETAIAPIIKIRPGLALWSRVVALLGSRLYPAQQAQSETAMGPTVR